MEQFFSVQSEIHAALQIIIGHGRQQLRALPYLVIRIYIFKTSRFSLFIPIEFNIVALWRNILKSDNVALPLMLISQMFSTIFLRPTLQFSRLNYGSHYSDGIKFQALSRIFQGRNYNFPG